MSLFKVHLQVVKGRINIRGLSTFVPEFVHGHVVTSITIKIFKWFSDKNCVGFSCYLLIYVFTSYKYVTLQ